METVEAYIKVKRLQKCPCGGNLHPLPELTLDKDVVSIEFFCDHCSKTTLIVYVGGYAYGDEILTGYERVDANEF